MIGPLIAAACSRCPHTLGDHNKALGVCALCDVHGGPCSWIRRDGG